MSKKFLKQFFNYLLPDVCVLCHEATGRPFALCTACEADLPTITTACLRCGNDISTNTVCGDCIVQPPPYDKSICLFHYREPLDYLITSMKFRGELLHAHLLGQLMSKKIVAHYKENGNTPECIIPVPLHKKRLQARTFNQAIELARPISKALDKPINLTACERIRATAPQTLVPVSERKKNLKGAFQVNKLDAKHIAIIDDVVTTGHTISQLSLAFKKAGVQRIDIWCAARVNSNSFSF